MKKFRSSTGCRYAAPPPKSSLHAAAQSAAETSNWVSAARLNRTRCLSPAEEASALMMTDVALADLEVTLEDKLVLDLVGAS
jgi:hypothetical protein